MMIKLIPSILRPLLSWICLLPNRWHHYKCSKHLAPFIRQRKVDLDKADKLGTSDAEFNDFTTWFIRDLDNSWDPSERTPEKITLRLMALNFAAIHTSTFTATNILFDLFSTPPEANYVQVLRDEVEQVLAENNGKWNKNALARLVKVDSAIRKSLRISTFMSHGMDRLVVDPKGLL